MSEKQSSEAGKWVGMLCAGTMLLAILLPEVVCGEAIPSGLRAAILLRALEYEKTFASSTAPATLLVLSRASDPGDGSQMTAVLQKLAPRGGARPIVVEELRGEVSGAQLANRAPTALYVAEGNDAILEAAASVPRAIVLCGNAGLVGRGCILSVEAFGESSRLVVDIASAREKGLTFDARLLRVARVIR